MIEIERIQEYRRKLPEPLQAEVLDFVEYLVGKVEREASHEEWDWSALSLGSAMRDMEDEDAPMYTLTDLKATLS